MKTFRYLEDAPVLSLDQEACVGCGLCVTVCPHRIFELSDKIAQIVDRGACMECGACALNCPTRAISVNEDEGCGCAVLIVKSWLARVSGKNIDVSGCC